LVYKRAKGNLSLIKYIHPYSYANFATFF